ncbi:hypothetical protein HZB78_03150 [Candidatus Collierbacteria bacterium]|nr:hypothetical protein [Candidatus Collierbacteria bacterium]
MLAAPPGFDVARHFPKAEYPRITDLVYESISCGVPIPISAATCPDYLAGGYNLGSGIGDYARTFLTKLPELIKIFKRREFQVNIDLVVADGDAVDPFLMSRRNIDVEEFLRRTRQTQAAIQTEIKRQGLGDVTVSSLLDQCKELGIDYAPALEIAAGEILKKKDGKVQKVRDALIKERLQNGEFQQLGLLPEEYEQSSAYELAGYALYGALVGPDAIVCTMSSTSAVAGLNMLKTDPNTVSPTIYVYEKKEKYGLFID